LAINAFTPSPTLVIGDITEADFDGYAALSAASAATQVFQDPATGDTRIQVREPAGGWTWIVSGNTNLPQTVYGYVLTDPTGATVYGSERITPPIVIPDGGTGMGFSIPDVGYDLISSALQ